MMAAGVEMPQYHTEPTLLRVGDDNLCAISLVKEDEKPIVIYLTESKFDPYSELLTHPFSQTNRGAGELGGNIGHNKLRRTTMGLPTAPAATAMTGVQAEDEDELELNYEENDSTTDVDTA
eukprot:jgi/Tetstr1/448172/TSEL_035463.t1